MNFEVIDNRLRCRFDNQLNTSVCAEIAGPLESRIDEFKKERPDGDIEFDMGETEYICSAFIRLCLFQCKSVGRDHFLLRNLSEDVRQVFDIAGLTGVLRIE